MGSFFLVVLAGGVVAWAVVRAVNTQWGLAPAIGLGITIAVAVYIGWRRTVAGMLSVLNKRITATEALKAGDFQKAESLLLEGIALADRSTSNKGAKGVLQFDLANLYVSLERFDEAIWQYQRAIESTQGDTSPYDQEVQDGAPVRLLGVYSRCGRWQEFQDLTYRFIAEADPASAAAMRLGLVPVLETQERFQEALVEVRTAEQILASQADPPAGLYLAALDTMVDASYKAGDVDGSLQASQKLLRAVAAMPADAPDKPEWEIRALCANGEALLHAGQPKPALAAIQRALSKAECHGDAPMHAYTLYLFARALQSNGEASPAIVAANQAVELWGDSTDVHAQLTRGLLSELTSA